MKKTIHAISLLLAVSILSAKEIPSGFWHYVNMPIVLEIDDEGQVKQLGSEALGTPVEGTFSFIADKEFKISMHNHAYTEEGYLSDESIFLKNQNTQLEIWLPYMELKEVSEERAKEIATFYEKQAGQVSETFKKLEAESNQEYLKVITEGDNEDEIANAYSILQDRNTPIAVSEAVEDLKSTDPYVWLSAAIYLGHFKKESAVPYLIKSLRHTAWRGDDERVKMLEGITGQEFGNDFIAWKAWWTGMNPSFEIDWEGALGFRPRLEPKAQPDERGNSE